MPRAKNQATPAVSLADIIKEQLSGVKKDLAKRAFDELNKPYTNESPNMTKIDVPLEKEKPTRRKKNKHFLDFIPDISEKLNFNYGKPGAFRLKIVDSFGTVLEEFTDTYYGCVLLSEDKLGTNLKISNEAWKIHETNELYAMNPNHRLMDNSSNEVNSKDVWALERIDTTYEQQSLLSAAVGPYVLKRTNADCVTTIVTTGTLAACSEAYEKLTGNNVGYIYYKREQTNEPPVKPNYGFPKYLYPQGTNRPMEPNPKPNPFYSPFVDTRRFAHSNFPRTNPPHPESMYYKINRHLDSDSNLLIGSAFGEIKLSTIRTKVEIILTLKKIISEQFHVSTTQENKNSKFLLLECLLKSFLETLGLSKELCKTGYSPESAEVDYSFVCDVALFSEQLNTSYIKILEKSIFYDTDGNVTKTVVKQYTF